MLNKISMTNWFARTDDPAAAAPEETMSYLVRPNGANPRRFDALGPALMSELLKGPLHPSSLLPKLH